MTQVFSVPCSVRLELTRACNLRCPYCIADASQQPAAELNTAQWLKLFTRLHELQVLRVSLSGGEPLIRPDALELIEALARREFSVSLLSNGTLVTRDVAKRLRALGVSSVWLSFDGLRECHDAVRGTGAFERALIGLRHVLAQGLDLGVNVVPMRHTVNSLGGLVDLLVAEGVNRITVSTLRPEGRCHAIYESLAPRYPDDLRTIREIVDAKRSLHTKLSLTCGATFHFDVTRTRLNPARSQTPNDGGAGEPRRPTRDPMPLMAGCSACRTSCHITASGDVLPCAGMEAFSGGNIKTRDLLEVWRHSARFREIAELNRRPVTDIRECADCPYNSTCWGGCRADAFKAFGSLLAPDPVCPHWRRPVGEWNVGRGDAQEVIQ